MISGDEFGIVNRLLLNEKIAPSPEGVLRTLGFVHVYTASSLHLFALEAFLSRFCFQDLRRKRILTVGFWFYLFLIWKIQGFRLGFARVLFLFFLRTLAKERGFRWRVFYPLFLAFCFDFALGIDSGWMHYYLAVFGGLLGMEMARKRPAIIQHLSLSIASWWMTAPLDLFEDHRVSWMTPVWSLVTIPIISLFLYPVSVLSYTFLGRIPEPVMDGWNQGASLLLGFTDWGFTFSVIENRVLWVSAGLAILAALFWIQVRDSLRRIAGLSLVGIGLFIFRFYPFFPETRLIQMNVGQGDSLFIQKNGRTEMIDVGSSRTLKPESMIQRLSRQGVTKLDTILLSHLDEDHAGGLRVLLPWIPVDSIEVNPRFDRFPKLEQWLSLSGVSARWCPIGCFQSGRVDWISKTRSVKTSQRSHSGNSLMGTAMIPLSNSTVYLSLGDADQAQEFQFLNLHRKDLKRFDHRILKISHHGSRHSSSGPFLSELDPDQAVISVGRKNSFHHPHPWVLERLQKIGIRIHRTDRSGDFIWNENSLRDFRPSAVFSDQRHAIRPAKEFPQSEI